MPESTPAVGAVVCTDESENMIAVLFMVIVLAPVMVSAVVLATTFPTATAMVLTVELPVVMPTEVMVTFPITKFAARLNTVFWDT